MTMLVTELTARSLTMNVHMPPFACFHDAES
jgi:hypothetical protein